MFTSIFICLAFSIFVFTNILNTYLLTTIPMIAFQNVSKIYSEQSSALHDVTFKVEPHEFVSLVGRSGAGKSTVIKLLIGEEKPSKGRVIFGSYEVNKLKMSMLPALRRHKRHCLLAS